MHQEPTNKRILVIDDQKAIHEDFKKILREDASDASALGDLESSVFGGASTCATQTEVFDVDFASQGQEGLEVLQRACQKNEPYAMAFVDMRMPPGWDGLETIERLWEVDGDLEVVVCTAYSDYEWEDIVKRLGQSDKLLLLKKPFDSAEVWQLACALTHKRHLVQANGHKLQELHSLALKLEDTIQNLQEEIETRKAVQDRLRHYAYFDVLTGLPNRAHLTERIEQCRARAQRDANFEFALLFLDIDNFKLVNDSLGHKLGDELLIMIAERLKTCLRSLDMVSRPEAESASRLGGDEFVVLLEGIAGAQDSVVVAERLLRNLGSSFEVAGHNVSVSSSVGITLGSFGYENADDMLRDADIAMYRAKEAGKARYAVFSEMMHASIKTRLQLENDLRQALEEKLFCLAYQPIYALPGRQLVGFEALIRWRHPDRGLIPPGPFISAAEESRLIIPIGRWVLEEACRQMAEWALELPDHRPLYVNVNLSRIQLAEPGLLDDIKSALTTSGIPPQRVNLEVTESAVVHDCDDIRTTLQQIKALDLGLHMDDFGTGYSSLSCLHHLPFDVVKIDRAFAATMDADDRYAAVIQAIIQVAHALGMRVTIEGIETEQQLGRIAPLGCDFAQGFLFARPMDAAAAAELIERGDGPPVDTPDPAE